MSTEIAAVIALFLSTGNAQQHCAKSGIPTWSEQVRSVLPDCETRVEAPQHDAYLVVGTEGRITVFSSTGVKLGTTAGESVQPPAMVSWSPDSRRFFVNDGQSSGMTSTLRVFSVSSSGVTEHSDITRKISRAVMKLERCGRDTAEHDLWGFGWSRDGRQFYVLATPTVHRPCGTSVLTFVIDSRTGMVVERLGLRDARERFSGLLPKTVLADRR